VTEKEDEQFSEWDRSRAFEASGVPVYGNTIGNHQIAMFETGRHLAFVISKLTGDANPTTRIINRGALCAFDTLNSEGG
jgi:hypothetical protein